MFRSIALIIVTILTAACLCAMSSSAYAGQRADEDSWLLAVAEGTRTEETAASKPASEPASEPAPEAAWPPGMLMDGFDSVGMKKAMDALGLRMYGFVETGFMGRLTGGQDVLPGRLFDARRPNNLRLNQLRMTLDRPYDSARPFDIGARADVLYGGDAFWTRALGLNQMGSGQGENWFDPVQFYVQPWIKTGPESGLEFTVGKFWGTIGYEYTDAALSSLYSHSYMFNTMGPFTVTGVQTKYVFNKEWYAYFSIVNGWDDFRDNNNAHSYIAGGCWSGAEQIGGHSRSCAVLNTMTGPEQPDDVNNYRTVVDGSYTYWWTEKLSQAINADWETEEKASETGGVARSYGTAHYLSYIFNDYATGVWRSEWFRDDAGVRLGTPAASWYEMTWGVNITPWPNHKVLKNLIIRPEFRWDFADKAVFGDDHENQLTAGLDVIFKF